MTIVQTQKQITVHCPTCGHFRSRHTKEDGCVICAFEIAKGWRSGLICGELFPSRLNQSELDQARAASKDAFAGTTRCATCLEIWWSHNGYLCPNGMTLFVPLIGGDA